MKKWLWLCMTILTLTVGCGVGPPTYRQDAPDYWKKVLYHQSSAVEMQKGAKNPDKQIGGG
jgi:hypothetical protein